MVASDCVSTLGEASVQGADRPPACVKVEEPPAAGKGHDASGNCGACTQRSRDSTMNRTPTGEVEKPLYAVADADVLNVTVSAPAIAAALGAHQRST